MSGRRRAFVRGRHGSAITPGSSRIRPATVASAPRSSSSRPRSPGRGRSARSIAWPSSRGRSRRWRRSGGRCVPSRRPGWVPSPARTGLTPVSASYSTSARENRSADAPAGSPCACSGAMYATVPITSPVMVSESPPSTRATPKSVNLASAAGEVGRSGMSTLDGLTSRWITPLAWACASASHSAIPTWTTSRSDSRPSASSRSSVVPWTSSDTRYAPSSSTAASYRVTIPGCASLAAARASRSNRPPFTRSRARILTATSRSSRSSCAIQTVANPPVPRRRRSR